MAATDRGPGASGHPVIGIVAASALAAVAVLVLRSRGTPLPAGDRTVGVDRAAPGEGAGRWAGPAESSAPEAHAGSPGRATQRLAAGIAGVACAAVIGGAPGLALGVLVAVGLAAFLSRLEPGNQRRERAAIAADAPIVADLLGAALAAGVPIEAALPVVAEAIGGPLGARLRRVSGLLLLGQPADSAWERLGSEPSLLPLVSAVTRSARTGAPLALLLTHAALDLRAQAHASARAQIRAAGVRSVLPLGLCLLPAFVLLSVVPMIGSLVAVMWR